MVRTWQAPADDLDDAETLSQAPAHEETAMTLTLPSALATRLRAAARGIGTDPETLAVVLLGQQVLSLKD